MFSEQLKTTLCRFYAVLGISIELMHRLDYLIIIIKYQLKEKYEMLIREYTQNDIPDMIRIWNEVVEEGIAFPQEECLNIET